MVTSPAEPHDQPHPARPWHVCVVCLIVTVALPGAAGLLDRPGPVSPLRTTLDPDRAAWWELATLPGLGEGKARAIVDHRLHAERHDDGRVFRTAADLDAVYGIGPVLVQRLAPHLNFTTPAP